MTIFFFVLAAQCLDGIRRDLLLLHQHDWESIHTHVKVNEVVRFTGTFDFSKGILEDVLFRIYTVKFLFFCEIWTRDLKHIEHGLHRLTGVHFGTFLWSDFFAVFGEINFSFLMRILV